MKVFPDTNVWLSGTVFAGLCEAILIECHQRQWLLTSRLVQTEAYAVLDRKFPHYPRSRLLFDRIWTDTPCVPDVSEPQGDNDARLVAAARAGGALVFITGDKRALGWGQQGQMKIWSPRDAWTYLFVKA